MAGKKELDALGELTAAVKALTAAVQAINLGSTTTPSAESVSTSGAVTADDIVKLCGELGAKVCRKVLKDAGYTKPSEVAKDEDLDADDLQELYDELMALKEENDDVHEDEEEDDSDEDEDEDEDDDEEEVTLDMVKEAVQEYTKEFGKDETKELLEEYDIKSVKSLKKLSQEDLEELYEAITED